jgi:hypothetical protein
MVLDSEQRYTVVKGKFMLPNKKLRQSWCKLSLRERAVRANFEDMYGAIYALSSELSHGSFGGLVQHIESFVGDNWQSAIPPCLTRCAEALGAAHYCTLRVVGTLVALKEIDSTPSLAVLKSDYDHVWSEKQNAAIA